jgi:hypothetical protein
MKQTWTNAIASDDNGYSVGHAGAAVAGTTNMTLGGALCTSGVGIADFARNVAILVTHASSVVAMSGTITGTDINNDYMTEAWSVTATGTSKAFTGKRAFKTVTAITETIASDASTNTIIAGTGVVLGLQTQCAVASGVKETSAGSVVTNGVVAAASSAGTDDPRGTYAPNTVPDGAVDYVLWYLSDTPENDLAHP